MAMDGEAGIPVNITILRGLTLGKNVSCIVRQRDFSGVVHSVFKHALNFTDALGRLYTVLPDYSDNGPQSVRVEWQKGFSFLHTDVLPGSPVSMQSESIIFAGNLMIDLAEATLWERHLPPFPLLREREILKEKIDMLRAMISCHGKPGGMKMLYSANDMCDQSSLFEKELRLRAEALLYALRNGSYGEALAAGLKLLGFGLGSTPSGDDFLTGLITVWNMPSFPFKDYRDLGCELARKAKSRTTAVSQAMLALAACGQARERVITLLESINSKSKGEVAKSGFELLQIGSTSGTDLAVGILAGLEQGLSLI